MGDTPRDFADVRMRLRRFWTRTSHRTLLTASVLEMLRDLHGTVLDIGGGRAAPHDIGYASDVHRVRFDLSSAHRPDAVGDGGRLPIRTSSIDAVVMCETLEHVPDPDGIVAEAHRVLRPGGQLVGSIPFLVAIHGDPFDYQRLTGAGIQRLLSGFDDIAVTAHGNHLSAAWALASSRSRVLRVANPLVRQIGRKPDSRAPEGYVFSARKGGA